MADRSLFERLARTRPGQISVVRDTAGEIDSVLRNLGFVFNQREGCSEARPDFGMPDFGDLAHKFPNAIPEITRAVKALIEKFEPRLKNVQVRHRADTFDPQHVRFFIRAELVSDDDAMPVVLDGMLSPDGRVEVRA